MHAVIAQEFILQLVIVPVEIIHIAAEHGAEARVDAGLHEGVIVKIHIEAGGYPACEVLHNGKTGHDIRPVGAELRLVRPDLFRKPSVKGHIVGKRAQEGHARMGVRVFKAGHEQIAV